MKIYLAGPMSGVADSNHPAFARAAALLRAEGHEVFSPAQHTEEIGGYSRRIGIGIDLAWICFHADGIALLPGWLDSSGARAEMATAQAIGLVVRFLGEET